MSTSGSQIDDVASLRSSSAPASLYFDFGSAAARANGWEITEGTTLLHRSVLAALALAALAWVPGADAQVFDFGKYPDLRGQWVRYGPTRTRTSRARSFRLGPSGGLPHAI